MSMMGENTPDYDGIWGVLDPVGNGFLADDEPHPSLIDSVGSDDFLLMDEDVRLNDHLVSSITDHGWDLSGASMAEMNHLPSFLHDLDETYDDRPPRTPSPTNRSLVREDDRLHEVTPEKQSAGSSCLPNMTELQIQYQRTLKKLASSMRRSDETRCIVKRQRLNPPSCLGNSDEEANFFSSSRARAMEESRQKLYDMIRQGTSPGLRL